MSNHSNIPTLRGWEHLRFIDVHGSNEGKSQKVHKSFRSFISNYTFATEIGMLVLDFLHKRMAVGFG